MRERLRAAPILLLALISLWLRLANLGYAEFQGDEIRALWRPAAGQTALEYLYSQNRGPLMYLVTGGAALFDPQYSSEGWVRLPFALAGILAIYFFYRLVGLHFGQKTALRATFFLSLNGLFIGLMRIAQYQPFVILFSVLALFGFTLACKQPRWKFAGIYAGMLAWTAAIFAHYDAIFIAPFAFYLLIRWYRQNADLSVVARLRAIGIPAALGVTLVGAYFIPYLLSVSSSTTGYWLERFSGEGETSLLNSSLYTFQLYNPLFALPVYALLGVFSFARLKQSLPILLWAAFAWVFMELVVYDPGTHIYAYLLPGAILVALGAQVVEAGVERLAGQRWGERINLAWLALLFALFAGVAHLIYVDHTPEYPYQARRIFFWKVGGPDRIYRQWIYGFPHRRPWDELRLWMAASGGNGFYASNEKFVITDFYLPHTSSLNQAEYYIYIYEPQSLRRRDTRDKAHYWMARYDPREDFEVNGRVVAEIYAMPPGSLEEILEAGY